MKKQIYFTQDQDEQVNRLLEKLIARGVPDLTDNKGNPSVSALFRYLVEKELGSGTGKDE